ncbi:MAG: hypothetical protein ABEH43_04150, partial [Flavobacteriales bacterium]
QDIYRIDFPNKKRNYVAVKGKVLDAKDQSPIVSNITLIDMDNMKFTGTYKNNIKNGSFILIVDPYKRYKLIVESNGYHSYTKNNLFFQDFEQAPEIFEIIELKKQEAEKNTQ